MNHIATYAVVFAVGCKGTGVLISIPDEMREKELLDGDFLEDNAFRNIPEEPGLYHANAEFWFSQGYCDGYPADGESDVEFRLTSIELQGAGREEGKECPECHMTGPHKIQCSRSMGLAAGRERGEQGAVSTAKEWDFRAGFASGVYQMRMRMKPSSGAAWEDYAKSKGIAGRERGEEGAGPAPHFKAPYDVLEGAFHDTVYDSYPAEENVKRSDRDARAVLVYLAAAGWELKRRGTVSAESPRAASGPIREAAEDLLHVREAVEEWYTKLTPAAEAKGTIDAHRIQRHLEVALLSLMPTADELRALLGEAPPKAEPSPSSPEIPDNSQGAGIDPIHEYILKASPEDINEILKAAGLDPEKEALWVGEIIRKALDKHKEQQEAKPESKKETP